MNTWAQGSQLKNNCQPLCGAFRINNIPRQSTRPPRAATNPDSRNAIPAGICRGGNGHPSASARPKTVCRLKLIEPPGNSLNAHCGVHAGRGVQTCTVASTPSCVTAAAGDCSPCPPMRNRSLQPYRSIVVAAFGAAECLWRLTCERALRIAERVNEPQLTLSRKGVLSSDKNESI